MSTDDYQRSALERGYARFLHDRCSATFIKTISLRYSVTTLNRLAASGNRTTRRAAILSIGYLGQDASLPVAGGALHDQDRGVRMLAEEALKSLNERQCGQWGYHQIRILARYNMGERFQLADKLSETMLRKVPRFVEAWYQRAISLAGAGHYAEAIESCRRASGLNRFHYQALSRMGDYHLMLGATSAAIDAYRRALQVHPGLEHVRACFERVRRTLEEL